MRSREYVEYINSDTWKGKRSEALAHYGHQCDHKDDFRYRILDDDSVEKLPACNGALQVHHKTYSNLGNEPMDDLQVLCEYHHKEIHEKWETRRTRARRKRLQWLERQQFV